MIMKNDNLQSLLHRTHVSSGHGVHDIIIYNVVILINVLWVFKISLLFVEIN